jgi:phage antirepressor YoqD-like protein
MMVHVQTETYVGEICKLLKVDSESAFSWLYEQSITYSACVCVCMYVCSFSKWITNY